MKTKLKYFTLGFVFCLAITGLCFGISQVSEVYFSNFPIKLNGNIYSAQMPILNYQGRTYLALREFATVTNNEVDFIDSTIIINNSNKEKDTQENIKENITIYITKTGKKYHYSSSCNNGTYIPTTLENALNLGLQPCSKCIK